jgi:hypothetical protein
MAARKPTRTGEAGLIANLYTSLRKTAKAALGQSEGTRKIAEIVSASLLYLATRCEKIELRSRVPGKRYFAFQHLLPPDRISRPVNADLFIDDPDKVAQLLKLIELDPLMTGLSAYESNRLPLYRGN